MAVRGLPAVDALTRRLHDHGLPRLLVVEAARAAIDSARHRMTAGDPDVDPEALATDSLQRLARLRHRPVINATGVLLHTNLGRAVLAEEAAEAAMRAATGYGNLELDMQGGDRGGRGAYAEALLCSLTGAEAALVVNNNAGALFLTLLALAHDRAVPVSRGELIEIGGSYRLPDLMAATGARLIEVGTTNRTRLSDFEHSLGDDPALLLQVHPSNYRIAGFTEDVLLADLVGLGASAGRPVVLDAGSGLLDATVPWLTGPPPPWLEGEPGVRQALHTGADLVLFSGDKLLGGPQSGIIAGRADLVERLRRHPAARAMRIWGPALAALAATLELYAARRGERIPFWRMAGLPVDGLRARAEVVLRSAGAEGHVEEGNSLLGAGTAPATGVPTALIVVDDPPADRLWPALLAADPVPVVARREAGRVVLDLRAVPEERDVELAMVLAGAARA